MRNFHGSLFLALEFLRDLTQFCGISQGLSFVLFGICRDKVKKKEKFQGSFHKSISSILIFSGIAHSKVCLHHGAADK